MPADKPKRWFALGFAAHTRRVVTVPRGQRDTEAAEKVLLLIIFASTETTLCTCVKEAFAESETVRVILDRRNGERRREARTVGAERRYGERRDRLLIGEQLRSEGWAFVYRLSL